VRRRGLEWEKVKVVRPSIISAISNEKMIAAPLLAQEFLDSKILSHDAHRLFRTTERLKFFWPRSWGGLGLKRLGSYHPTDLRRVWRSRPDRFQTRKEGSEKYKEWKAERDSAERVDGPAIECLVSKEWFESNRIHHSPYACWDEPVTDGKGRMVRKREPDTIKYLEHRLKLAWELEEHGWKKVHVPVTLIKDTDDIVPIDPRDCFYKRAFHTKCLVEEYADVVDPWGEADLISEDGV
jgi:hypothetical protein